MIVTLAEYICNYKEWVVLVCLISVQTKYYLIVCQSSGNCYTFNNPDIWLVTGNDLQSAVNFYLINILDVGVSSFVNKASYCLHMTFIGCPV